jgi:iron(III) transport system substrate-binding protein
MKKYLKFLFALLVLPLAGCGSSEAKDLSLTVYSPNSEGLINACIPLFEEKTGIKVDLIQAGTGDLMKRISAEASDPSCDVMFGGSQINYYTNKDLFQNYVSTNDKNLPDAYQNKAGYCTSYVLDGRCLIVNKQLIGDVSVTSYADLLKPELKGKISAGDPSNSSSAFNQLSNQLAVMGGYESDTAWTYVSDLLKQVNCELTSGSSGVYKAVADGEKWVGVSYEDPCCQLVKDGANVQVVYPTEGTIFNPSCAGIVKGAKHLDNAKKFVDFIITSEVQDILGSSLTNRPVLADAKVGSYMTPIKNIVTVKEDTDYVFNHKADIVSRFKTLYASLAA